MEIPEEYNNIKIIKMKKAIRQLEFNPENYPGEVIDEISETIPGQAYSVSEVLIKFTQGTLGNIGMPTYYDYEEEIEIDDDAFNSYDPTLSPDFDISDAQQYLATKKETEEYLRHQKELEDKKPEASDERTEQISDNTTESKKEE